MTNWDICNNTCLKYFISSTLKAKRIKSFKTFFPLKDRECVNNVYNTFLLGNSTAVFHCFTIYIYIYIYIYILEMIVFGTLKFDWF